MHDGCTAAGSFGSASDHDEEKEDADEINRKAAAKREEAVSRISNTDARTLCESLQERQAVEGVSMDELVTYLLMRGMARWVED